MVLDKVKLYRTFAKTSERAQHLLKGGGMTRFEKNHAFPAFSPTPRSSSPRLFESVHGQLGFSEDGQISYLPIVPFDLHIHTSSKVTASSS